MVWAGAYGLACIGLPVRSPLLPCAGGQEKHSVIFSNYVFDTGKNLLLQNMTFLTAAHALLIKNGFHAVLCKKPF